MKKPISLTVAEACALLGITKQSFHANRERGMYVCSTVRLTGGIQYSVALSSLPAEAQSKYWQEHEQEVDANIDPEFDAQLYSEAPDHARRKADKYLNLIRLSQGLKGQALREWIAEWNHTHPAEKTSYQRLVDARKAYVMNGIDGLLGKRGGVSKTLVPDDMFAYGKALYLKEGGPSIEVCWRSTIGWAKKNNPELQLSDFPSSAAFRRRLFKEVPEYVRYEARAGKSAANRKYGFYIKRSMDDVLAGECWVSDHAQIDIACSYKKANGKDGYGFPWVTTWVDYKSGLWLGWDLHMEAPNSDDIFLAFYRAANKYGIPKSIYIDNGKDYRSKDFSGGRRKHNVSVDERNVRSLTGVLGIETTFSWPYNGQSKSIAERCFRTNKDTLSVMAAGYRGGNVVERPECLNDQIKKGRIEKFSDFVGIFDKFITDVINRSVITTGHRKDMSPEHIFATEHPIACERKLVKSVTTEALKLFCCRTSGDLSVSRRGIKDSALGIDYYADWMEPLKGSRKVYMRRDPKAYQEGWVFDSATNEFIGKAYYLPAAPGLARTDIERSVLKANIGMRRNADKSIKAFKDLTAQVPLGEHADNLAAFADMVADEKGMQRITDVAKANHVITQMDHVLAEEKRQAARGTHDISNLVPQKDESDNLGEIDLWARVG